jgi:drug/metabolite transporter (DMT)-like permease
MNKSNIAIIWFVVIAGLLGLTFPLIENSMQSQDPYIFVALRFVIASICLLPFLLKRMTKELLLAGAILGVLNYGGYLTQTIGLQTVNASRAAFLTGTNVIFISFFAPLFRMQPLSVRDILSALVCCFGIYVLTGCDVGNFTPGDGWIVLCAMFVALSIIYMGYLSKKDTDPILLTGYQIVATALFSLIPCLFFSEIDISSMFTSSLLIPLLYCSIFATILTLALQAKYQKYVSAQKVGLILCLEPVFASFFDMFVNGTVLHINTLIGGFLILTSIIMQEMQNKTQAVANSG